MLEKRLPHLDNIVIENNLAKRFIGALDGRYFPSACHGSCLLEVEGGLTKHCH